ncbi:MAG: PAC2 family protein [Chloroflexi bacterium]|nr:PAC2 family protein [Chloroflexota bacterium]MCI0877270.1 PAC2 family protein [Chloroflexota bacterium]
MRVGEFEINEPVPELKDPHVLAVLRPWIDVGNVGTLSLERIERHYQAEELGRLARPGRFYDFTRYRPRSYIDQGRRGLSIPNTVIRYIIREDSPDLVFAHLLEPHNYGEDYTESMVELLKFLGAKRYMLLGAMYDMVPHTRPLLVSGGANQPQAEEEYRLVGARPSNYEGPTTITYLISQQAEALGIETRTFVVHLPQYFQVDEDFTGAARLMEVLCSLYDLPESLKQPERGREQYKALENIVNDASGVSSLLQRLEERYDREQNEETGELTKLSPNIEEFLRTLDEGFDSPQQR